MKWCRFETDDGISYGIVENDRITQVVGDPFNGYQETSTQFKQDRVKLLVPVVPPTLYAGGLNYPDHVVWAAEHAGTAPVWPTEPRLGARSINGLIPHEGIIVKPHDATDEFQYEGELVAVIGKYAKHLSREDALSCVLGYTIGNDVSERSWQRDDPNNWRAKDTDTFHPMGPVEDGAFKAVKSESGQYQSGDGTIHIVSGGGGATFKPFADMQKNEKRTAPEDVFDALAKRALMNHFIILDISQDVLKGTVWRVCVEDNPDDKWNPRWKARKKFWNTITLECDGKPEGVTIYEKFSLSREKQ